MVIIIMHYSTSNDSTPCTIATVDSASHPPIAVIICNTSLHILNALEACSCWSLATTDVWLVVNLPSKEISRENIEPAINLATWGRVVWVEGSPRLMRGINFLPSLWRQLRYHRKWQQDLVGAKGVRYVFLGCNRMAINSFIAVWLKARQLIWLDDGTLSFVLSRERSMSLIRQSRKPKARRKK